MKTFFDELFWLVRVFLLVMSLRLLWACGVWLYDNDPILYGAFLSFAGVVFVAAVIPLSIKIVRWFTL